MAVNAAKFACRKNDTVGRLGCEEFGILLAVCGNHIAENTEVPLKNSIPQCLVTNLLSYLLGPTEPYIKQKDLGRNKVFNY
jgi:GGDEF domain-containing protein